MQAQKSVDIFGVDAAKESMGKPYFDFTIVSIDGDTITGHDLQGKVTVINFWFSTCAPCIAEFDELESIYEKYKNDDSFQFLSITRDDAELARKSVKQYQLPYAVCSVADAECRRLNYKSGYPTTLIIDQEGKLCYKKSGGPIDQKMIIKHLKPVRDKIDELLEKRSK